MTPDPVAAARALAPGLAARAADLERDGVRRSDLDELAAAGLHGVFGPPDLGGASPQEQREVAEVLSGASPDAWFVWYQHGPVVRALAGSENGGLQERHLPGLCRGDLRGAVSYSHLRTPRPSVHATRVEGGWSFTGTQPWCTGWPDADLLLAGALDAQTGQVVLGLVPAGDRPELRSTGELGLAAMAGTSTHALAFDGLVLPDDDVVLVAPHAPWTARDTAMNTNVQPSTFGVALAALDLLEEREPGTAGVLRSRLLEARAEAYRLLDDVDPGEQHDERLAVRARALRLGVDCATALVTARGGQAFGLADPAQRLLRAAAFQVVHSQAAHIRAATLAALVA